MIQEQTLSSIYSVIIILLHVVIYLDHQDGERPIVILTNNNNVNKSLICCVRVMVVVGPKKGNK